MRNASVIRRPCSCLSACQPSRPTPTLNTLPAERSGAERCPAQSGGNTSNTPAHNSKSPRPSIFQLIAHSFVATKFREYPLAQELERLARLHAEGALTPEEFAKAKSRLLSAPAFSQFPVKGIRRQSSRKFCGLPLWAVAIGPDPEHGENRGHARGIFALGDMATSWFACGGVARGFFAVGGLAIGLFAFGGGAIGVLVAIGGGAIGGFALGGAAIGIVAVGGGACGYYALGGSAIGVHAVSAMHQDPVAVDFFRRYFPCFAKLLPQ